MKRSITKTRTVTERQEIEVSRSNGPKIKGLWSTLKAAFWALINWRQGQL